MTPEEIVSAILDDYLITRSIDDVELESRLVAALHTYGDERTAAARAEIARLTAELAQARVAPQRSPYD